MSEVSLASTVSTVDFSSDVLPVDQMRIHSAVQFLEAYCEGSPYGVPKLCSEFVRVFSEKDGQYVGVSEVKDFIRRRRRRGEIHDITYDEGRDVVQVMLVEKRRLSRAVKNMEFDFVDDKIQSVGMIHM